MPGPIITLTSEEDDLHHQHAEAVQKSHPGKKPILELAVAQDGRPFRSQVPANILLPDAEQTASANGATTNNAAPAPTTADLPEVISEEDEETPSEGEPLTPSDDDSNIFHHHHPTAPASPRSKTKRDAVGSAASSEAPTASASASASARSSGVSVGANVTANGNATATAAAAAAARHPRPQPGTIFITPPDTHHTHQAYTDSHEREHEPPTSGSPPAPSTPITATRSPRSSATQFFPNPFASSSSLLRQPSSGTKPSRRSSIKNFFRRNSSALTFATGTTAAAAGADGDASAACRAMAQQAHAPAAWPASPASSVAAESAASGSGSGAGAGAVAGSSPTEGRFRFGLKRRQSPPIYADGAAGAAAVAGVDATASATAAGVSDAASPTNMPARTVSSGGRGGTWPLSPAPSQQSQHSRPSAHYASASSSQRFIANPHAVAAAAEDDAAAPRTKAHSHSHPSVHLGHLRERSKILFGNLPRPLEHRMRSSSVSEAHNQPPRPGFSIPAAAGVGLKARRMSASLPDDFHVDTCELDDEYVSASKLPGKRGKALGKGATATVKVMARRGHKKSDCLFAVKEFRKCGQHEDKQEYIKKVKSEYSIAASLHHPNIVTTYSLCTHNGRFNHVMEMCQYGELFTLVQKNYLGVQDNLCFFKQVVRGVGYLHANGIAHRDIKLENLLLTEEGHVKISDFGVSEVFCGIHPGLREAHGECGIGMKEIRLCQPGICGSMPYISPEVLAKKQDYDPRALDVWSCAIVMITLACRGNPWQAAEPTDPNYTHFVAAWDKFLHAHPDGLISEYALPKCGPIFALISQQYSPGLRRLLLSMLHPNPAKRATIVDVLSDKYFKTIECCSPESSEDAVVVIDAAGKGSTKKAGRMSVQKAHHHAPPERKILPQHRFDMGDGYS